MSSDAAPLSEIPGSCPSPAALGRSGWDILHSSAAVYPYNPSPVQQAAMTGFINGWAHLYACSWCAYHMRQYVAERPPVVTDKLAITRYVCELHNEVNERTGKDTFDCDPMTVLKRWHPGFPDKMADEPTMEEKVSAEERRMAAGRAERAAQQSAQEERLTVFGWGRGRGRKQPEEWREGTSNSNSNANDNPSGSPKPSQQFGPTASSPKPSVQRWWVFGGSAYEGKEGKAATTTTTNSSNSDNGGKVPTSGNRTSSNPTAGNTSTTSGGGGGKPRKASDDETDVDAVLARLRGCQVYCPEDDDAPAARAGKR